MSDKRKPKADDEWSDWPPTDYGVGYVGQLTEKPTRAPRKRPVGFLSFPKPGVKKRSAAQRRRKK